MVVDELTSSVQAKGTKAVVAATAAILTATMGTAVEAKPSTLVSTSGQSETIDASTADSWGAFADLYKFTGEIKDVSYLNNSSNVANGKLYGGIADLYETKATLSNSEFKGTKTVFSQLSSNAGTANSNGTKVNGVSGGVFFVKNGTNTFVDVTFSDNTIESTVTGVGALVAGGAIFQDAVMNAVDGVKPSALTIEITKGKDVIYSGNNVTSATPDVYYDLYGTVSTTAGGFLFLDRESSTNFKIGEGATLVSSPKLWKPQKNQALAAKQAPVA